MARKPAGLKPPGGNDSPKATTHLKPAKRKLKRLPREGVPQPKITSKNPTQDVSESESAAKSKLTPEEISEFRDLLLAKRREIIGDMGLMADGALGVNRQDAAGDLSLMPQHMADLGSDNWEQEFNLGLIENQRQVLREVDEALQRIEDGTYGICVATGRPISKARLHAKPWAKYCIEYARQRERRGLS